MRKAAVRSAALAALTVMGAVARAEAADDPALFPAAQCAALWFGQDDYAQVSTYLGRDPRELALAEAFRQVALRLTTQDATAIDAFIAAERRQMRLLVEAFIFGSDRPSRDLYESLMQDCADFAARHPETRSLR